MITKSVLLRCGSDRAFVLFTEHAGLWWPVDRRHTKDPESAIRMRRDGRFWERSHDGREVELGRVRQWQPGERLLLDFYVGTGPEAPTEVEVTFAPEDQGTRVTVVHRPGAAGELWGQRAPLFERSWTAVLEAFEVAASDATQV